MFYFPATGWLTLFSFFNILTPSYFLCTVSLFLHTHDSGSSEPFG